MAEIIGVDDISYCNDCYGRGHYTGDVPVGICLFPCPWVGDMTREMIQQATKTRCIHHRGNPRESRSHPYQSERDTCTASATFKRQSDCEDKTPSKGVCKDCHYFESERDKALELLNDLRGYANGEYAVANLSDNEHDARIHLEYENRIWGIMKELRQAGEP
jgi:hypothetical protein